MLPAAHRMRRSVDFERAVRRGVRAGRSTVVVHLAQDSGGEEPPQVGFVVSKAVGNAVHRNKVKRRLRAASSAYLDALPPQTRMVVRALPAASASDYARLEEDLASCIKRAVVQWDRRSASA